MPRELKVYGWRSFRMECPPAPNGSRQTREIIAAHSVAEVCRLTGVRRSEVSETGNEEEVRVAMKDPGVVFWRPLDGERDYEFVRAGLPAKKLLPASVSGLARAACLGHDGTDVPDCRQCRRIEIAIRRALLARDRRMLELE